MESAVARPSTAYLAELRWRRSAPTLVAGEATTALAAAELRIYQHGTHLVHIALGKIKTTAGIAIVPRLAAVQAAFLRTRFAEVARFVKWNQRTNCHHQRSPYWERMRHERDLIRRLHFLSAVPRAGTYRS
jgi:hypothetical protein